MTSHSDNEQLWSRLMVQAQDGNRQAYDQLLREIVPFIASVVSSQHRSSGGLEEVLQEVLLTMHRVRQTYDPSRPFKPWLAMIARRRSIDVLRRQMRTSKREIADDVAYVTFADPRANRAVEEHEKAEGLREVIERLPAQQREAVELLKLKEMSLAEASLVSGRSVAALKVNMHRAIKALRAQLSGDRTGE